MRLDASGRWFMCLTVFRVGYVVEGALKASGLLPIFTDTMGHSRSAEVSQDRLLSEPFSEAGARRQLGNTRSAQFHCVRRSPFGVREIGSAIEGDFCRLVRCREARQGLASQGATTHSLPQPVACPEELSHEAPGGQACCFSLGRLRRGPQVPLAPLHAARSK